MFHIHKTCAFSAPVTRQVTWRLAVTMAPKGWGQHQSNTHAGCTPHPGSFWGTIKRKYQNTFLLIRLGASEGVGGGKWIWADRRCSCTPLRRAVKGAGAARPIHRLNHGPQRWWVHPWIDTFPSLLFLPSAAAMVSVRVFNRWWWSSTAGRGLKAGSTAGRGLKAGSCYAGISLTAPWSSFTSKESQ